jgi:hypothetical protein
MWEDNIKFNVKGIGCECLDWIKLAQDYVECGAVVNSVNIWVSTKARNVFIS